MESRDQLHQAANRLIDRGVDAIVAASSGTLYENIHTFIRDADRKSVPVFSFYKMGVSDGAVVALSSDYFQIADELLLPMAQRVLKDKVSPGSMPAAFLDKTSLFVNRSQARRFNLHIPPKLKKEHEIVYVE